MTSCKRPHVLISDATNDDPLTFMNTLKYRHYLTGQSHLVWHDADFEVMSIYKAGLKASLVSDTCMLQTSRSKFNQHR